MSDLSPIGCHKMMEELMVEMGTIVQGIKQSMALRSAVYDER